MSSPSISPQSFFDDVGTQNLPTSAVKEQPWTRFHASQEQLALNGSVECDVPSSKGTGSYIGRSTQTGSLGGL